jgi:hypothetical protein
MSVERGSSPQGARPRQSPSWLSSRALWAGLSIATMWLAVLFVGVFGGNIVSAGASGTTSVPVVVALLPFVLPGTIVVGRRGFSDGAAELRPPDDDRTEGRENATAEAAELRTKVA